jgi:hypothetical protein
MSLTETLVVISFFATYGFGMFVIGYRHAMKHLLQWSKEND